jgi:hypothetical protein
MTWLEHAKRLRPRRRRWERLLRSLDLDPARLPRTVEQPTVRDFVICGLPRSGTSLLAAALYQPPASVVVMEPWDALRMPPAELFRSLRDEIETGTLRRGRLDVETLRRAGEVRWGRDGDFPHAVEVDEDYVLGVKFPVLWRYLDLLPSTKFLVCLRHPAEVVQSFASSGGRLAEGLDYEVTFNREMNDELRGATEDVAVRRALLFEYVASRIVPHLDDPNVLVVRYERWFTDREGLMRDVSSFLGVELGPGMPAIRPPRHVQHDPNVVDLVERHCPSARALGYQLRPTSSRMT